MAEYPRFEVWKEYERIAMHFNDLLMRIRIGGIAAVTAVAGLAGVVLKSDVGAEFRWDTLAAIFAVVAVLWIALWVLDYCYYNRLLLGSVDALLEIEKTSGTSHTISSLELSTLIEKAVGGEAARSTAVAGRSGTTVFYGMVLLLLLGGLGASLYWGATTRQLQAAAKNPTLDCTAGDIRHVLRVNMSTRSVEDVSFDPPHRGTAEISDAGYLLNFSPVFGDFRLTFRINRFTAAGTRILTEPDGKTVPGHGGNDLISCKPYGTKPL